MYLEQIEPERQVFLAVPARIFEKFFQLRAIDFAVKKKKLRMLVFDEETGEVKQWIK